MDEQKEEFCRIIQSINNPKLLDYLLNLVKYFLKRRGY